MDLVARGLENLTSEFNKNPRFAFLVLAFIIISISVCVYQYKKNAEITVDGTAQPGQFSHSSSYVNISAMKHDMWKQTTIDLIPSLVIFAIPSLLYYLVSRNDKDFVPIIKFDEIITFESWRSFNASMIGRTVLSSLGYFIFYSLIQPKIVNYIPFY